MKLHYFSPLYAEWLGSVEKALILNHLLFWTRLNSENECYFHEGRTYVPATAASISKRMPYLMEASVCRWMRELVRDKYLVKFQKGYDRTTLYSVLVENLPQETVTDCFSPEQARITPLLESGNLIGETVILNKVERELAELSEKASVILTNPIGILPNAIINLTNPIGNSTNVLDKVIDKEVNKVKDKKHFGEFNFVLLLEKEAETYINKHGLEFFKRAVERLENWIGTQPEGSKERKRALSQNHYFVLNGWVQRTLYAEIKKETDYSKAQRKFKSIYGKQDLANQKLNLD